MEKKCFKLVTIICIVFLSLFICNFSYGFVKSDFCEYEDEESFIKKGIDKFGNPPIYVVDPGKLAGKTDKEIVEKINEYKLGYNGTKPTEEMKFYTYIKIKTYHKFLDSYSIQFGETGYRIKYKVGLFGANARFTIDELKEVFGLDESVKKDDLKEGYTWNVNIIVGANNSQIDYYIWLKALYSGADLNKIDEVETSDKTKSNVAANVASAITNGVADWVKEFCEHPGGKIIETIMDPLGSVLGDGAQWLANLIQSIPDDTYRDTLVLYTYKDLATDNEDGTDNTGISEDSTSTQNLSSYDHSYGVGNRDKYTKIGEDKERKAIVKEINVKKDKDKNGEDDFSTDTKIPLIIGDLYGIAADHVDFLDVNFLSGSKTKKADGKGLRHAKKSIWNNFSDFSGAIIRISIYLASAILLMSLIWYGINIVRHTFDNPRGRADAITGLTRLRNALGILIGTILFMAICIFGSKAFCNGIVGEKSYELPIRVNVEDTYSFSTTPTGYIRYMSLTTDLEEGIQKLIYTLIYIALAIVNLLAILFMIIRMFVLWGLSIIGPIISVFYVFGRRWPMNFRTWASLYGIFSMIQAAITIIYTLILNVI